jgi:hypothetical protein
MANILRDAVILKLTRLFWCAVSERYQVCLKLGFPPHLLDLVNMDGAARTVAVSLIHRMEIGVSFTQQQDIIDAIQEEELKPGVAGT